MTSTSLVKASLYHRFPGGKEEMAIAVIDWVSRIFAEHILAPLQDQGPPHRGLTLTASRIKTFYAGGAKACLLETMSFAVSPSIREHVWKALDYWIGAFAQFAAANGFPGDAAHSRAEEAVASIEGALVLARLTGDRNVFERALAALPSYLIPEA